MLTIGSKVKIKNIDGNFEIVDFEIKDDEISYILNNGANVKEDMLEILFEPKMELQNVELEYKDKFTNLYHLKYKNLNKEEKIYELLSRKELKNNNSVGKHIDAITMIIKHKSLNKYLLLREYRLAVNTFVYNLVAGLIDEGETPIEACIREVWEETNLSITKDNIVYSLGNSYSSVGLSDEQIQTFFIEVDGDVKLKTDGNPNECIYPRFYSLDEIRYLLKYEMFTSRTQMLFEMICLQEENKSFFKN